MQNETRYRVFRQLYKENPNLRLGGVTVGWLKQAFTAIEQIKSTSASLPVLLLQAEKDTIVDNQAQNQIVSKNKLITKKVYQDSWHEILFEQDLIRDKALQDIFDFFKMDLCE